MTDTKQAIWRLVELCAQELTRDGITPFTRPDLVRCVQRKNPRYGSSSINPIIQGVTDNLHGGAPGAVGKNILHSVGRGLFVLHEEGMTSNELSLSVARIGGPGSGAREARDPKSFEDSRVLNNARITRLGNSDFRYICALEPERASDGTLREFMPQGRYDNAGCLPLNRYGKGPFCRFRIPRVDLCGVYGLTVNEQVQYIGECAELSRRFNSGYGNISPRNCFVRGQETNCRVNNLVLQQVRAGSDVSLWFFATDDYKSVERELRISMAPRWNRT